jgi:predicted ATP-grasp superfamily ATP-dependent carboligase
LIRARDPHFVAGALRAAGLPGPAVHAGDDAPPMGGPWLIKPLRGAGGRGISHWSGGRLPVAGGKCYLQEFVEGEAVAAVYIGDGRSGELLGVTRQLVGSAFCHAAAFQYCGSVGPLKVGAGLLASFRRVGEVLAVACRLRGLFGVDGMVRGEEFWPVEVNPRYTASVEVLEYATGLRALARHRAVFEAKLQAAAAARAEEVVGKAVVMAAQDVVFPEAGPWDANLRGPVRVGDMPAFADIPCAGEHIKTGRPVMTLLARAGSVADCVKELERRAGELDRWLFGA